MRPALGPIPPAPYVLSFFAEPRARGPDKIFEPRLSLTTLLRLLFGPAFASSGEYLPLVRQADHVYLGSVCANKRIKFF